MKQLLILSGKGGTGKTTVASAFIKLSKANAYADCDVDAPNLHLVTSHNSNPIKTDHYGLPKAQINPDLCIKCNLCKKNCRFDAISVNTIYRVDHFACEGCGVCETICPQKAIALIPTIAGELMVYTETKKVFSTAQLKMGHGGSGILVTKVKRNMADIAENTDIAIIDGSPGIGCPVIASISGVDMVLIVAEPSISGISDIKRIIRTAEIFNTQAIVCVNKYDTNLTNTETIKEYCQIKGLPFVGEIPFDSNAVKAINNGRTIVDIDCIAGTSVKKVFDKTIKILSKLDIHQ